MKNWDDDFSSWVDEINQSSAKINDMKGKTTKWVNGKLEVVCPACKNIAEHKEFTTFKYWYCNTCKAEV